MKKILVAMLVLVVVMCWAVGAMAMTLPATIDGVPFEDIPQTGPVFTVETVDGHYEIGIQWDRVVGAYGWELLDSSRNSIALKYDEDKGLLVSESVFDDETNGFSIFGHPQWLRYVFMDGRFIAIPEGISVGKNGFWEGTGDDPVYRVSFVNYILKERDSGVRLITISPEEGRTDELSCYFDEDNCISEYKYSIRSETPGEGLINITYGADGRVNGCAVSYWDDLEERFIHIEYDIQGNVVYANNGTYIFIKPDWFGQDSLVMSEAPASFKLDDYPLVHDFK